MPRPEAPPDVPGVDTLLCFNLYAASHAFTRIYKPLLEPLGLTYPQYLVLLCLARSPEMGVGALSETLRLETNTLSPLLKRLETAGLIRRSRQSTDERRVRVELTDRGRTTALEAARIPERLGSRLGLAPDALHDIAESLATLRRALDAAAS